MLDNGHNLSPWDVLSLGTLCPLGPFVSGTFCLWDVLSLGTFCPWDVLSWKVWSLGCLSLGRFVPGTFCMCIKNLNHMLEKQYVFSTLHLMLYRRKSITLGQCATVFNDAQSKILYRHT